MQIEKAISIKRWILIALVLSVLGNLFALYRAFDMAITIDYMEMGIKDLQTQSQEGLDIIRVFAVDNPSEKIRVLADRMSNNNILVKWDADAAHIGHLTFRFLNGKVATVSYLGEE